MEWFYTLFCSGGFFLFNYFLGLSLNLFPWLMLWGLFSPILRFMNIAYVDQIYVVFINSKNSRVLCKMHKCKCALTKIEVLTLGTRISASTATTVTSSRDTAGSFSGAVTSVLIDPIYTGSPIETKGRCTLINVWIERKSSISM